MKLIGPRFRRGIDDSIGGGSKLRRIGSGLNCKLLQRIRRRNHCLHCRFLQVFRGGVVVDAVQLEVVLEFQVAVGAEASLGRMARRGLHNVGAGLEKRELIVIAPVERKIVDLLAGQNSADSRRLSFEDLGRRIDLNLSAVPIRRGGKKST